MCLVSLAVASGDLPRVLLAIALLVALGRLGGDLAVRLGQPSVLGELVAGILVGNLGLVGLHALDFIRGDASIALLAELGVVLLLFEIGLESTVSQMARVGASATAVAVIGVVTPLALGFLVGRVLLPQASPYVPLFLGAALTATSVGITARVLRDLGQSQTAEARIILGAAVIDDVLGLVVLAIVGGIIGSASTGEHLSMASVGAIIGKAAGFLIGAVLLGWLATPRLFRAALRLRAPSVLLGVALAVCFSFAGVAGLLGLAPIVGAFAAGLVLEPVHYRAFVDKGEHELEELIAPLTSFLAPIFFVLMGLRVDLATFARGDIIALAGALTAAALIGKQACSLGVIGTAGSRPSRLVVGIGMIPRGEVGLIFANYGLGLRARGEPVVDAATFSAIVIMVVLTTLATPPALKWSLGRRARAKRPQ